MRCQWLVSGLLLAAVLSAGTLVVAQSKDGPPGVKRQAENGRLREGSKITDVLGRMEVTGDRTTFTPAESSEAYRLLENLSLERINQVINDSRDKPLWEVSGVITEFRGSNYLLVTRAVIKASMAPPATTPLPRPR
jgi:hypothetical protein